MSNDVLRNGIRYVFQTTGHVPASELELMTKSFCNALEQSSLQPNQGGLKQLDMNLFKDGGYVFLWDDVIVLGDIVDALLSFGHPPNELGEMAWKLLGAWRRMRKVRVKLTEDEFRVLRAIKTGNSTTPTIASSASIAEPAVDAALANLRQKRYKDDIPLIEEQDGKLTTRF